MDTVGTTINQTAPNFRLQTKCLHLTYTHVHLNLEHFRDWLQGQHGGLRFYSMCHEEGKEGKHPHTHVLFEWNKRPDITECRIFDRDGCHPNIRKVQTVLHKKRAWLYHEKEGGYRICSDTKPFTDGDVITKIRAANSLAEACEEAGVNIKSVSDVLHIRADSERVQFQHEYPGADWNMPDLQAHERRCIFIRGPSGCGKTQWALHQFENPLLVSHMDALGKFDASFHDGIVFDDMSFAHFPREAIIHLVDWDCPRDIHIRYKTAQIPKHTRKIFTSNKPFHENFPNDEFGAIRRRFSRIFNVSGTLFTRKRRAPNPAGTILTDLAEDEGQSDEDDRELLDMLESLTDDSSIFDEEGGAYPERGQLRFGNQRGFMGLSPPNSSYHEYETPEISQQDDFEFFW